MSKKKKKQLYESYYFYCPICGLTHFCEHGEIPVAFLRHRKLPNGDYTVVDGAQRIPIRKPKEN